MEPLVESGPSGLPERRAAYDTTREFSALVKPHFHAWTRRGNWLTQPANLSLS